MERIIDQLYQNKTQYEDIEQFLESTLMCGYCADKLRSNKEVARSCSTTWLLYLHLTALRTLTYLKGQ